jgi:hypothetical protein
MWPQQQQSWWLRRPQRERVSFRRSSGPISGSSYAHMSATCSPLAMSELHAMFANPFAPTFASDCNQRSRSALLPDLQDKSLIKAMVPLWAPGLQVARQLAIVRSVESLTDALVASLPSRYVMKATHGARMLVVVDGAHARLVAFPEENTDGHVMSTRREAIGRKQHAAFLRRWCGLILGVSYSKLMGQHHYLEPSYAFIKRGCLVEESRTGRGIHTHNQSSTGAASYSPQQPPPPPPPLPPPLVLSALPFIEPVTVHKLMLLLTARHATLRSCGFQGEGAA